MKIIKSKFEGVFWILNKKKFPATINSTPGYSVYGEKIIKYGDKEYRIWNPYRSKWAAALIRGIKNFPLRKNDIVLYLGSASGTSASHIADIVTEGKVFCIDIAERVMRDLIFVAEKKKNIIPILADAAKPETYEFVGKVDFIFQDVATPNQDEILIKNAKKFLKKGGHAMIAVKSRSINVLKAPSEIFKEFEKKISEHFKVMEKVRLEPFEKDHIVFLLKYKFE